MVLLGSPKTPPARTASSEQAEPTPVSRASSGGLRGAVAASVAILPSLRIPGSSSKDDGNSTTTTPNERGGSSMLRMLRRGNSAEASPSASQQTKEFSISVDKSSGSSLGIGLDTSLVVTTIDPEGLVASWNATNSTKEVKVGYQIIQANGKLDLADMIEKLKAQELLELRFAREATPILAEPSPATTAVDVDPSSNPAREGSGPMKAWANDVACEETPSPKDSRNLKSKFDVSSDVNDNDGKDGDLVELPSPSVHTSLLSHSSLSPRAPMSMMGQFSPVSAANKKMSPGDLVALRELAVETAAANGNTPAGQQSPTDLMKWAVSENDMGPGVPNSTASPLMRSPGTTEGVDQALRNGGSPAPDDNEGRDIAPVHSSLSTSSPSFHHSLRQDTPATETKALFSGMRTVNSSQNGSRLHDQLQTHGAGATLATTGFLNSGPFWTCGSAPSNQGQRQRGSPKSNSPGVLDGLFHSSAPQAAAAVVGPLDISSRISGVLGNCINMLTTAMDVNDEPEPPEEELTTVLMETKEQRLQWRDFLSEAVSKCRADSLFKSFDVEPDPPKYARPPLSMAPKVDAIVKSYRQAGKSPPHVVAPRGAGWSSIGPLGGASGSRSGGSRDAWKFSGGMQDDPDVAIPVQAIANDSNLANGVSTTLGACSASSSSGPPPIRSATDPNSVEANGTEHPPQSASAASSSQDNGLEGHTGALTRERSWPNGGVPRLLPDNGLPRPDDVTPAKKLDSGVGLSPGLVDSGLLNDDTNALSSGADVGVQSASPTPAIDDPTCRDAADFNVQVDPNKCSSQSPMPNTTPLRPPPPAG